MDTSGYSSEQDATTRVRREINNATNGEERVREMHDDVHEEGDVVI